VDKGNAKINPAGNGGIKRFSDSHKAAMAIPPVVEPIQIQLTLAGILVQIRHVAVVIRILPDRAKCIKRLQNHHSLKYSWS